MSQNTDSKLFFASDYMEGAHPAIMQRLMATNMFHSTGYGTDEFSEHARALVRKACDAPEADVYFLVGGTQTNSVVISTMLHDWEGVIAAVESSHAIAHVMKIAPTMSKDDIIIVCLSGRGDKDVAAIARYRGVELYE